MDAFVCAVILLARVTEMGKIRVELWERVWDEEKKVWRIDHRAMAWSDDYNPWAAAARVCRAARMRMTGEDGGLSAYRVGAC